jgi:hypothetical protein
MGVWFPRWPSVDSGFHENESPFGGARRPPPSRMDLGHVAQGPRSVSNGIVFGEVLALKLEDVSDQQFLVLSGHPDEAAMEAIGVRWINDGINAQHFEGGFEEHLAGKEQCAGENLVGLKRLVDCDTDAAAADVDGPLDERFFSRVALTLQANR